MGDILERTKWISGFERTRDPNAPSDPGFVPLDPNALAAGASQRFIDVCHQYPNQIAVTDGVTTLTYAELLRAANNLAWKIATIAPAGRPVATVMANSALFPVALMATSMTGRILVGVDVSHPVSRQAAILEESGMGLLLVSADAVIDESLVKPGTLRLDATIDLSPCEDFPVTTRVQNEVAAVTFTSGSTGRPKGIAYPSGRALTSMANFINTAQLGPKDKILSVASPAVGGGKDCFNALLTGATLRIVDLKTTGIAEALRIMGDEGITVFSFIPLAVRGILQTPGAEAAFRSLRILDLYSDRTLASDIALFHEKLPADCCIRVCLASTEVGMMFDWWVPRDMTFDSEAIPVGYLSDGKQIMLLGEDGEPVGPGEEGEIVVRSQSMALGAWQDGKLVPGRFLTDPEDPSYRIYHVGDLVRIRPDGLAEFGGRRDRQIKIRGHKTNPTDVEATIRHLGVVADVAVVPRPLGDEHVLVAYVVAADPANPTSPDDIRAALADELTPHTVPVEVHYLDAIPRLPNYKADMVTLKAIDAEKATASVEAAAPPAPPPAALQDPQLHAQVLEAVGKAWTAVLNRKSFDADQPWDQAGGDSLKSLQLVFHIEAALNRSIPLDVMSATARPSWLADAIVADIHGHADAFAETHERPTVFLLPGLAGDEPRLAAFRRALARWIKFELVDYPDIDRRTHDIADPEVIVGEAVARIQQVQPAGPLFIAGFSFGGMVGYEVVRRLEASGRKVAFFGLLDTPAYAARSVAPKITLRQEMIFFRQAREVSGSTSALMERMVVLMVAAGQGRFMRRLIWATRSSLGAHRAVYLRKLLLESLRRSAMRGFRLEPYTGPVTLFRAQEQMMGDLPPDLGWSAYAPKVEVVEISGGHHSQFDNGNLEPNAARFLTAMARAVSSATA